MTDSSIDVHVTVTRGGDGSTLTYRETFAAAVLTEAQFNRVVSGIAAVTLPPDVGEDRDGPTVAPFDTSRTF